MSVASGNSAASRQSTVMSLKSEKIKRQDSDQFRPPLPSGPPPEQYALPDTVKPVGKLSQFARKDVKYALEVQSGIGGESGGPRRRVFLITSGSLILINTENGLKIATNLPTTHVTDVQVAEVNATTETLHILVGQRSISVVVPKSAGGHNLLSARQTLGRVLENVQQRRFRIGEESDVPESQAQSEPDHSEIQSASTEFQTLGPGQQQVISQELDQRTFTSHEYKSQAQTSPASSRESDFHSSSGVCPHCSSDTLEPTHKFCPQCGGRLPFDTTQQLLISHKAPILSRLAVLKRSMADVDIGFVPNDDDEITGLTDGMKTSIIRRQQGAIAALKKHVESQAKFTAEQALQLDQLQAQIVDDLSSVSDTTLMLGFSSDEDNQKGEVKTVIHAPVWRDGKFHQLPPEEVVEPKYPNATEEQKREILMLREHVDSMTKGNYLEHLRKETTGLQKQISTMSRWAKMKRKEERQKHRNMRAWVDSQVKVISTDTQEDDNEINEHVKRVMKLQQEQQQELNDLRLQQQEVKAFQETLSPPKRESPSLESSVSDYSKRPTIKKSKSNISSELVSRKSSKKSRGVPLYPVEIFQPGNSEANQPSLDTATQNESEHLHRSVSQITNEDIRWIKPKPSSQQSFTPLVTSTPAVAPIQEPERTLQKPENAVHLMPPPPREPPPMYQKYQSASPGAANTRFVSPPKMIRQARWIAPTCATTSIDLEASHEQQRERDRERLRKIYQPTGYDN